MVNFSRAPNADNLLGFPWRIAPDREPNRPATGGLIAESRFIAGLEGRFPRCHTLAIFAIERKVKREPNGSRSAEPMPTTMNISLPDMMKAFVEEQVQSVGYGTVSEYVRDLVRRD